MLARGTFKVTDFKRADLALPGAVTTALPVGVSTMEKTYDGGIVGRSSTIFTSAFDPASGVGSYVAMESFEGQIGDKRGTFNFLHSASTKGSDRSGEYFAIAEGSGTADFKGIRGSGGISVDAEAHRIWFELDIL